MHNKKHPKNFSHLHKQESQVNVPNVTPVDHFATNKFSKQELVQIVKPERSPQFSTKSLAMVTMSFAYQNVSRARFSVLKSLKYH